MFFLNFVFFLNFEFFLKFYSSNSLNENNKFNENNKPLMKTTNFIISGTINSYIIYLAVCKYQKRINFFDINSIHKYNKKMVIHHWI